MSGYSTETSQLWIAPVLLAAASQEQKDTMMRLLASTGDKLVILHGSVEALPEHWLAFEQHNSWGITNGGIAPNGDVST
jgi:hypothetical protein